MSTSTPTTPAKAKAKAPKKAAKKAASVPHSKEVYQRWFRDMYLMRKFEERCGQLYIQQKFGGFCHLYIGQEAILSGISEAIVSFWLKMMASFQQNDAIILMASF